ncbi:CinA family protein [Nocardioides sp. P5_C9_2]
MATEPRPIVALLTARGATVATAESLTGGRLAALLTSVPGASACVTGGVVAYATAVKVAVLGVPADTVAAHGVVSGECAAAMATGVRALLGTTYAMATTGVAGPDPQEGHPAGHVWVAAAGPEGVETRLLALAGDRAAVQDAACREALSVLEGILTREEPALR